MTVVEMLFYFFILLSGVSALAILLSKNVFKSAIFLLVSLLSVAALYALSFAEFLAVAQILIYAGGITVLIIFGIMLTTRISGKPLVVRNAHMLSGGVTAVALLVLMILYLSEYAHRGAALQPQDISATGLTLFAHYSLPFEIAGLLLLMALVGAAVITSHLKSKA